MAKKYYAVKIGMKPGIYRSWDDCKRQVHGFPGAVYKSFENEQDALTFMEAKKGSNADKTYKMSLSAYTDGSFDGVLCGWGFVFMQGKDPLIQVYGPGTKDIALRNIGGEIEAAEEAIRKAVAFGADHLLVYHDYEGVGRWGDKEWKCNNPETEAYRDFVDQMRSKLDIEFVKVKGHTGDQYNEVADQLANAGRTASDICVKGGDGLGLTPEDEKFLIEEQQFLASQPK